MRMGILIVFPFGRMDAHPTMRNLLRALVRDWEFVHVVCAGGDVRMSTGDVVDRHLVPMQPPSILNPFVGRGSFLEQPCARLRSAWAPRQLALWRGRYAAVIGVDPEGLIQAHRLNRGAGLPLAYLSFEIMFRDEIAGLPIEAVKAREIAACKDVGLVLVQDEERGAALCEQNQIDKARLVYVPNGPESIVVTRGNYLRARLNIPDDKRIVLYAGNLRTWASRDFFDEMVSFWPEEYVLVLHNWVEADSYLRSYLQRLKKAGRIYVSEEPLPMERLTELYGSADFGLAPFKPTPDFWDTGWNIYHMGLSSGKVGYYALCGLPIIASDIPVFLREFRDYDCGGVYALISETGELLQRIDTRYSHHSGESARFYRERMDPSAGIVEFCEQLRSIAHE